MAKEKNKVIKKLSDLVSVGPATLKDFQLLEISNVAELAKQDPTELYEKLSFITNSYQDPLPETICCAHFFEQLEILSASFLVRP